MADRDNGKSRAKPGHDLRATAVIRQLRRRGSITSGTLAEELGVATRTLSNTLSYLHDKVVVSHRGRLLLQPNLGLIVGVDVSDAMATAVVAHFDFYLKHDVDDSCRREIAIADPDTALRQIAQLIADQLAAHATEEEVRERLIGVGLTMPGPVLREPNPEPSTKDAAVWDRRLQAGPILPGWDDVNVGARLATLLKDEHGLYPPRHEERRFVWMENDASAGALGVHADLRMNLMAKAAPDDILYVRVAEGIGAGVINKGHLVTGARGFAGELGHVIADPAGALCPRCGRRGCLETLASNLAVMEQLRSVASMINGGAAAGRELRFEEILACGHPAVDRALWDAGWHVGTLLAKVCCVLNPAAVVLNGAMPEYHTRCKGDAANDPRPFVAAVKHALERETTKQAFDTLRVDTWSDLRSAGQTLSPELLGALALAVDHLGDAYLVKPIERWMASPDSREERLSFSVPCDSA